MAGHLCESQTVTMWLPSPVTHHLLVVSMHVQQSLGLGPMAMQFDGPIRHVKHVLELELGTSPLFWGMAPSRN